ncbi:deoxyribonuclease-2 domain protein [Ancylostoma caninum]|uniref:Deoxyribonuclease-2 domain protein n=1 Tax=Ancylostoma caninum TaxID=29170 RepID=A0A368FAV1_ANCCA|nr:deoxyribonuclease-2 domain protein [Ancylostoma caninum]
MLLCLFGAYDFPKSGSLNAQSFLCLSLSVNFLDEIGQYMRFAHVAPFLSNLPEFHKIIAPSLVDVVAKRSLPNSATVFKTIRELETLNGTKAKGFSKNKKFGQDLWYNFIAPTLKTSMSVETWRKGSGKDIGSQCSKNKMRQNVYDVEVVKLLEKSFSYSKDHSKWGVSVNANVPAVCIGDINRQESQFKRGGGAVCIEDMKLWKAFHARTPRTFEKDSTKGPKQKTKPTKRPKQPDNLI